MMTRYSCEFLRRPRLTVPARKIILTIMPPQHPAAQRAFTLIELLVVIGIIGILAAIAGLSLRARFCGRKTSAEDRLIRNNLQPLRQARHTAKFVAVWRQAAASRLLN